MEYINFIAEYYKTNQLTVSEKKILLVSFLSFIFICLAFFLVINFYDSRYNVYALSAAASIFAFFSLAVLIKSMVNFHIKRKNTEMLLLIRKGEETKKEIEELKQNVEKIVSERTLILEEANLDLLQQIEERNQVEKSLLQSRKKYHALFDNNPVSIITVDKDLKVTSCNLAKKKSGERVPETGDIMYRDYAAKHRIDMYSELKECVEKGVAKDFPELKYKEKYLNIRISPFFEGAIIASIDITCIKNTEKTIHTLTQELLRKQEMERRDIALSLHDGIAQELASLKISCDSIIKEKYGIPCRTKDKVADFSKVLQGSISTVRNIAYELQPPNLAQLGLNQTVYRFCKDFSDQNSIKVNFQSAGMENLKLDFETSINIFRLIQEALDNVKKYSGSKDASVKIVSAFPSIIIRIDDSGKGFDLERYNIPDEKKTGIQNMKERTAMLGGKFEIKSRLDCGTKIYAEIPMPKCIYEDIQSFEPEFEKI